MSRFKRVFLTGSTGFFGAHLAAELLRDGVEDLLCHVRAGGAERVISAMQSYDLWQEAWRDHITAVSGDLEKPQLGMDGAFTQLPSKIDAVIHNGANVNYVLGIKQLRSANVTATQDALRIAEAAGVPFYFISTLRLFDHRLDGDPIKEDDVIDMKQAAQIGYTHSKVMSERLVKAASMRGLETAIFRPGLMCGDGVIGIPNQRDAISLLLNGCRALGVAPISPMQINLTSVNYAARGMVALTQRQGETGQIWHLVRDQATHMERFFNAVSDAGYKIEMVQYMSWVDKLRHAAGGGQNTLAPLLEYFTPEFPEQTTRRIFDSTKTSSALAERGVIHPDIDEAFLRANIDGMIACGFFPPIESAA